MKSYYREGGFPRFTNSRRLRDRNSLYEILISESSETFRNFSRDSVYVSCLTSHVASCPFDFRCLSALNECTNFAMSALNECTDFAMSALKTSALNECTNFAMSALNECTDFAMSALKTFSYVGSK